MEPSPSVLGSDSPAASAPVPRRSGGGRVSELDGLRGIAILLVLVFHFTPFSGPLFFLAHVFQAGWIGVDLFFVLSGYLITGILLDSVGHPHYYRNFVVRRTLRIFPLYYACLALYAVLSFYPGPVRWGAFLHAGGGLWYLGYLGNVKDFVQNAWPGAAILTPLWSLQVEEQFYLSFPFIVLAVKRKTLARILLGSIAAALLLRIILTVTMPGNKVGTYVLMPCRMDALAMGGLIAIARRDAPQRLQSRWIGWLTALCGLTFILVCVLYGETPWSSAMRTVGFTAIDLAFTGVLVLLISRRRPILLAVCRRRFLVWLGVISYGLYLLHIPARTIAQERLAPLLKLAPRGSAVMFVCLAVAICTASISWLAFESQVLKLKERFTVR